MSDDSRIDRILDEWRPSCEAGETISPDDVVTAHLDLADPLRAKFAALAAAKAPTLRDVPTERRADFRVLGQGGMAIVYWALDRELTRVVRHHAGDLSRQGRLQAADRDDPKQDLALDLLRRLPRFDAARAT